MIASFVVKVSMYFQCSEHWWLLNIYSVLASKLLFILSTYRLTMPGYRRFRLSVHRKNEERKRWVPKLTVRIPLTYYTAPLSHSRDTQSFSVSLPLSSYTQSNVHSVQVLESRLTTYGLPQTWFVTNVQPLTVCKIKSCSQPSQSNVVFNITIDEHFTWTLSVFNYIIQPDSEALSSAPVVIKDVDTLLKLIKFLDSCRVCSGNADENLLEVWQYRSQTVHGTCKFQICGVTITMPCTFFFFFLK